MPQSNSLGPIQSIVKKKTTFIAALHDTVNNDPISIIHTLYQLEPERLEKYRKFASGFNAAKRIISNVTIHHLVAVGGKSVFLYLLLF